MKACFAVAISANVIVAVEAQIGHGGLVERRVALIAVRLEFRMTLDQVARHKNALFDGHLLSPGSTAKQ